MIRLSHRGICVSDLDRSTRFYKEALDFVDHAEFDVSGPEMSRTMGLPAVELRSRLLKHRDGPVIDLMQFTTPPASGRRERRSTLQYGLVHLSFYVDDIDAMAQRLIDAGGHVFEETRAHFAEGRTTMLYCTDPDGIRIELMHNPDVPGRFSHSGICVENIDTSLRYYGALGFELAENYVLDQGYEWLAKINEVPGIKLRAQMVRDSEGNVIELLKVFEPASFGPREPQPLNRFGLTHFALWDDAPDARVEKLCALGGRFNPEAHVVASEVELQQGADPDGVRIELMRKVAN
jgi:catechol 2,3-dioxygenase-like lactoylglutathione lyase family enzyme